MAPSRRGALCASLAMAGFVPLLVPLLGGTVAGATTPTRQFDAGYEVTGNVTSVSATLVVPTLHCPKTGRFSTSAGVAIIGADPVAIALNLTCRAGVSTYGNTEITGSQPQSQNFKISAGDTLTLKVTSQPGSVAYSFSDSTSEQDTTGNVSGTGPETGGFVGSIVDGSSVMSLSSVRWSGVKVGGATLDSTSPIRHTVISSAAKTLVFTSSITTHGTAFTNTFVGGVATAARRSTVPELNVPIAAPVSTAFLFRKTPEGYLTNALGIPLSVPPPVQAGLDAVGTSPCSATPYPDPLCGAYRFPKSQFEFVVTQLTSASPGLPAVDTLLVTALKNRGWTVASTETSSTFAMRGHGFAGTAHVAVLPPGTSGTQAGNGNNSEIVFYFAERQVSKQYGASVK